MNAGGVSKACKSNGLLESAMIVVVSGKRVSNTLVTCLEVRDNGPKGPLIPDVIHRYFRWRKAQKALREGLMVYQLVGRVMAYQGYDG